MSDDRLKEIKQNLKEADKFVPKEDVQDLLKYVRKLEKGVNK